MTSHDPPHDLTIAAARRAMTAGTLTSERLVASCLERIAARDPAVKAFAFVDPALALAEARSRDGEVERGPLHGVPVAIKDMIDTADLPTEYNSPIYPGFRPAKDAACVSLLRSAGAVIIGKAATVEFASLGRTPPTENPHAPGHTAGGSSSGSGAAVGDRMVPAALGTQTGGSLIRPASFCGAAGMKPSFGLVPVDGAKPYAPSLDTIGWITRSAEDLALLAGVLGGIEPAAPREPKGLRIGLFLGPHADRASSETRTALAETARALRALGATVDDVPDLPAFAALTDAQDAVMHWEGRAAYRAEYRRVPDLLHPNFHAEVENRKGFTRERMRWADATIAAARAAFLTAFEGYDAWLTPAVPGEAPKGLTSTGEAIFNRMWTALHAPCVTLPGFRGPNGLPVGIQLVAPYLADAELLAVATAVETAIARR